MQDTAVVGGLVLAGLGLFFPDEYFGVRQPFFQFDGRGQAYEPTANDAKPVSFHTDAVVWTSCRPRWLTDSRKIKR